MSGIASAIAMSVLPMIAGLAWVLFIPFMIIYILERSRANRAGEHPGGLGAATIGSLMGTVGWQSLLGGVALLLAHMIEDMGDSTADTAGGLILGALIASVLPAMILRHAINLGAGRVIRSALGVNAALTGLISMGMTIGLCVAWFNDGEKLGAILAATLVYTIATLVATRPLVAAPTATS